MKDFSTPVTQTAVMIVSFKRMGTQGKSTGVIRNENIVIVRRSVSGGFSVHRGRSPPCSHRSLKSLNICFDILTPERTVPRTTLSTALIVESNIRLTTSASTIESPINRNTLTLKSIELPPRSAIVRISPSNFPADSC
ncbi:hypothetical protein TNCV_2022131 [Trichonephila clavipes]|nr:hypothetical protein TNCV_2022131 [Trichonephila clavipes]